MWQQISLYVLVAFYIFAGINHFLKPKFYLSIMPDFLQYKEFLNQLTGAGQVLLSVGLLLPQTRNISVFVTIGMLTAYLLLIHIPHLIHPPKLLKGKYGLLILRIPLQLLLMYWTWSVMI